MQLEWPPILSLLAHLVLQPFQVQQHKFKVAVHYQLRLLSLVRKFPFLSARFFLHVLIRSKFISQLKLALNNTTEISGTKREPGE